MADKINNMEENRSETRKMLVQPKIAADIMELQLQHALPIEITLGNIVEEGLREVTMKYELEDYALYSWLVDKATNNYIRRINAVNGTDLVYDQA